jgi:hypothetical protein
MHNRRGHSHRATDRYSIVTAAVRRARRVVRMGLPWAWRPALLSLLHVNFCVAPICPDYHTCGDNCNDNWNLWDSPCGHDTSAQCSIASCNICDRDDVKHYGCHLTLSGFPYYGPFTVELTNTDCVVENTPAPPSPPYLLQYHSGTYSTGSGYSICWDTNFHGSSNGKIIGSNPYTLDSSVVLIAKHHCGPPALRRPLTPSSRLRRPPSCCPCPALRAP